MHIILAFGVFSVGYFLWSRYIEKNLNVDCIRPTPAIEKYNKIDFVPTKPVILFGHHFSSIAGVGPIVGPILALKFGWLPTFLWLIIGVVIIGAVHDFASLMVSVRNGGKTIGDIMSRHVSKLAGKIYLIFTLLTVILVIAVFTRIVATSFSVNPVSASTAIFITLSAPILGIIIRKFNISQFISLVLAVVLLSICLFLGYKFPLSISREIWIYSIILYSFLASWLPVWVLLQPRDYINFFLLFSFLIMGTAGIISKNPEIKIYAVPEGTNIFDLIHQIFPFLFVTVACGAVSGFHSLVSSGTTSKQISSECHARPIGYGAMLFESLLGVISMTSMAIFAYDIYIDMIGDKGDKVIDAFAYGLSELSIGVDKSFAKDFSIIALSAFALTSLDTAARIGRYLLGEIIFPSPQENTQKGRKDETLFFAIIFSAAVVLTAYALINSGGAIALWQLFGTSNQLLAAFALITAAVWAKKNKYKNYYFILPAIFMFAVTLSALFIQTKKFITSSDKTLLAVSMALLLSAITVTIITIKEYIKSK